MPIMQRSAPLPEGAKEIVLAGGCFWGTQHYLAQVPGVLMTDVGYANGHTPDPNYRDVCTKATGYAEAVRTAFDPNRLSLTSLIRLYLETVDPTSINRQGNDVGSQYRTGIYCADPDDLPVAERELGRLAAQLHQPIAIELALLRNFYLAEEYHQDYLKKNPGGYCHIPPALFQRARQFRPTHDG